MYELYQHTKKKASCYECHKLINDNEYILKSEKNSFNIENNLSNNVDNNNNNDLNEFLLVENNNEKEILNMIIKIFEKPINTVTAIPKICKNLFTKIYTKHLNQVNNDPNSLNNIAILILLPRILLLRRVGNSIDERYLSPWLIQNKQKSYSLDRLKKWDMSNEGKHELLNEILDITSDYPRRENPKILLPEELIKNNIKLCKTHIKNGQLSKAVSAVDSLGVADLNEKVKRSLADKHPENKTDIDFTNINNKYEEKEQIQTNNEEILKTINSFPKGSGAGRDGLRPQHLKDMTKLRDVEIKKNFIDAMTKFSNIALKGELNKESAQILGSAALFPLNKPDNGIRPVAAGQVLRRMISKIAASKLKNTCKEFFFPHQLGSGIKSGANIAALSVQKVIEMYKDDPAYVLFKTDFQNAFNTPDRNKIFEEVMKVCPEIAKWVKYIYENEPLLFLGDGGYLKSLTGSQQGDPLGGLLFNLVIHNKIILRIKQELPGLILNVWFFDDGNIIGKVEDIVRVIQIIEEVGDEINLKINLSKSEIYWPTIDEQKWELIQNNIQRRRNGIEVLGTPIGNDEYIRNFTEKKIEKISGTINKLKNLNNLQMFLILLRFCTGLPKFIYILRSIKPEIIIEQINKFDEMINLNLEFILNHPISKTTRMEISLPTKDGGLGIPEASKITYPAFLGAYIQCINEMKIILNDNNNNNINLENDITEIYNKSLLNINFEEEVNKPSLEDLLAQKQPQHIYSQLINKETNNKILRNLNNNPLELKRYQSNKSIWAGSWLSTMPIEGLGLEMTSTQMEIALKMKFGIPVFRENHQCKICKDHSDKYGGHALKCNKMNDYNKRHNKVRDVILKLGREANLTIEKEEKDLIMGTAMRPGDVIIHDMINNKPLCIDVSIVNVYQTDKSIEDCLESAARAKIDKNKEVCQANNLEFLPFIMSSSGMFHNEAINISKRIAEKWARHREIELSKAIFQISQRIGFSLQQQIANNIIIRMKELD